jgi:hypothetical protein
MIQELYAESGNLVQAHISLTRDGVAGGPREYSDTVNCVQFKILRCGGGRFGGN